MINSMTGFGRGNAGRGKIELMWKLYNKFEYLDTKFRGVQLDFQLEQEIKLLKRDTKGKRLCAC